MFLNSIKKPILLFCLLLLLQSCGYSNPYSTNPSSEGKEAGRTALYITMWENRTGELGYQSEIHRKLIYWLNKSPNWQIVQTPAQADYIMSGVIYSADFPGLSYDSFENVKELRAEIIFGYKVKERTSDKILLEGNNLIKRETFPVSDSAVSTESAKRRALDQMAEDIADEIYIRLFPKLAED